MALFTDYLQKKGVKQMNDVQVEKILSEIIQVFCCLHGRDVFINSYTSFLANRLLNKASVSDHAEEMMIQKLQIECGHNTVNKIKTMLQDMVASKDFMSDFKSKNKGATLSDVEFSVEILTSSHWPISNFPKCTIPK